jgi:prepilin-type N-terminal cleavage/methylation domain-containing protein/prepilin-type processing-associated H-X9-DG protein
MGAIGKFASRQGLRRQRHALHGFTLIELLVVVAIISLLVSILLPSLQMAKELARQVLCQTNQSAVGRATHLYMTDYDEMLPSTPIKVGDSWQPSTWRPRLGKYLDVSVEGVTFDDDFKGLYPVIFECPTKWFDDISAWVSARPPDGYRPGTGFNVWCYQYDASGWIPVRLSQIPNTSMTHITMDTLDHHGFTRAPNNWSNPTPTQYIGFHHGGKTFTRDSGTGYGVVRYGGQANAVFFDGHGESLTEDETGSTWEDDFWKDPLIDRP